MQVKLNKNGSAEVVEPGKKGNSTWSTNDAKHTAAHVATWNHGDKKRASMSKGDLSMLKDFAHEHSKKK